MLNEVYLSDVEDEKPADIDRLTRKVKSMHRVLEISRQLATLNDREAVKMMMEAIMDMTRTKRGMLMLRRPDGKLAFSFSVNIDHRDVENERFDISRSIVERAVETGEILVVKNIPDNVPLGASQPSFIVLGLRAVMAIPLRAHNYTLGAIYIDTDEKNHLIYDTDRGIFEEFAAQAAIALENAQARTNLQDELFLLKRSMSAVSNFDSIIYQSRAMEEVCLLLKKTLNNDITVLIQGETGVGKELVARAIHYQGIRKKRRFLSQNAGALPDELIESELFGHKRGAFSGATEHKVGLFEAADGGTVFLDEIGEASPALQVRLLRLLETGYFRRVGDTQDRKTNVRILAATNRDLRKEVAAGRFREDLYYRLSVFPVTIPPLRERVEDVPVLVRHFVDVCNREFNRQVTSIPRELLDKLLKRRWPGNIRELKNVVQRMMVMTPTESTVLSDVGLDAPAEVSTPPHVDHAAPWQTVHADDESPQIRPLEDVERDYLRFVLDVVHGNQVQAAKHLGLNRSTLRWRLKKHGLV